MNRRGMLRIMSFGAIGASVPIAAHATKTPVVADAEKDGPICAETLILRSGTKKRDVKLSNFNDVCFFGNDYGEYKQVSMAVGKDGNLWLKTEGGDWKRVVTE